MFPPEDPTDIVKTRLLISAGWTLAPRRIFTIRGYIFLWSAPGCLEQLPLREAYQAWKLGKRCTPPLVKDQLREGE